MSNEEIKYVDFTSLYPYVNKYMEYPVGHPEIILNNFAPLDTYFGIVKLDIVPPRGLYHPVLPYRSNEKLKLPLCRVCADEEVSQCKHTDEERCLSGTWCIPEVLKAIEKGYIVKNIYEIYHWPQTTKYDASKNCSGLFSQYVNQFLKYKQEASGWPEECVDDKSKEKYISDYLKNEGVLLDKDNICKNPGLRSLSKLMLNSFWGKFGQRSNMTKTKIFTAGDEAKFFQFVSDRSKVLVNFHILSENAIQLEYKEHSQHVTENFNTNVYIATFTTCWARLKLYSVLEKLDRNVLYYDTDSVVYVSDGIVSDPPLGNYLGELTDELDGEYITEFVSGGPKNYAYRTSSGSETVKVRGFTLNFTNSLLINFNSIKELVVLNREKDITVTNPNKICRNKLKRKLYNKEESKKYKMVYTKRVILPNMDTIPYGF